MHHQASSTIEGKHHGLFARLALRWHPPTGAPVHQEQSGGGPEGGEQGRNKPRPGSDQGPPDLDEIWRDFNRRLSRLLGGLGGKGKGPGGPGGLPQPGRRGVGVIALAVLVVILAIWLGSGFFTVQEGFEGVITQFGKYRSTVNAGLNWRAPWPIQSHEIVNSLKQTIAIGGDNINKATGLNESAMLTSDENIVEIKFKVQFSIKNARNYLFNTRDPLNAITLAGESTVREVVGQMTMDEAMAEKREQIAPKVKTLMQTLLDRYDVGVEIAAVTLQQSGVSPPEQVKGSFDDVLKAGQERVRARNDAQAYTNNVVPLAKGQASRIEQDALGYKASVVARAEGDTQRFLAVLAQYDKAPQVTRDRLYIDTMRQIYSNTNKVFIDGRAGGNLIYLPLDKLIADNATRQPVAAASQPASAVPATTAPGVPSPTGGSAATVGSDGVIDGSGSSESRTRGDDLFNRDRGGR